MPASVAVTPAGRRDTGGVVAFLTQMTTSAEKLRRLLARHPGPVRWAWAAARDSSGAWAVTDLVIDAPAQVEPERHRYDDVMLGVEVLSPVAAARRLRTGLVVRKAILGKPLTVPPLTGLVHATWHSTEPGGPPVADPTWPQLLVPLPIGHFGGPPLGPLHARGKPVFATATDAIAEIVHGVHMAPTAHRDNRGELRLVDRRGRLLGVRIDENAILVDVELTETSTAWVLRLRWRPDVADARSQCADVPIKRSGAVRLPVDPVPHELTLVLAERSGRIVDRRGWSAGMLGAPQPPSLVAPRVERWLLQGEHDQLEFKQTLGKDRSNERFAESVCAMANTTGGVILIGVADDGEVVGYHAEKAADRITQIVTNLVDEPPAVRLSVANARDRPIVVVEVDASPAAARPHMVRDRILVRAGATNRRATAREIRQMTSDQDFVAWPGV